MADELLSALDICLYLCPDGAHLISQVLGICLNLAGSYFSSSDLLIGETDFISMLFNIAPKRFNIVPGGSTSSSIHSPPTPPGINYPIHF